MSEETIITDQSNAAGDATGQDSESPAPEREPNTRKVKLRRIMHTVPKLEQGKAVLDDKKQPILITEPVVLLTQASVPTLDGPYAHIELPATRNEFEFPAGDAAYLLREHRDALEAVPDAPTKLKTAKKD